MKRKPAKRRMRTESPTERLRIRPRAVVLTIAGSDPSGGAGLQADLKTFQQLGVYGMSVITLITAQNTRGVQHLEPLPFELIESQLRSVLDDIPPSVIKTGALGSAESVIRLSRLLNDCPCPIVVDPVLVSKHGDPLAGDDVVDAYREHLFPLAHLITPNRFEAERLTGEAIRDRPSAERALTRLQSFGPRDVLIKLGEFEGNQGHYLTNGEGFLSLATPRLPGGNTHGSGCILAAAIAAALAIGAPSIDQAVNFGIERTLEAIHVDTRLGHGIHPAETRGIAGKKVSDTFCAKHPEGESLAKGVRHLFSRTTLKRRSR